MRGSRDGTRQRQCDPRHQRLGHPGHPDGNYEMANLVEVFEHPAAIGWKPGYDTGNGKLGFGGWTCNSLAHLVELVAS